MTDRSAEVGIVGKMNKTTRAQMVRCLTPCYSTGEIRALISCVYIEPQKDFFFLAVTRNGSRFLMFSEAYCFPAKMGTELAGVG